MFKKRMNLQWIMIPAFLISVLPLLLLFSWFLSYSYQKNLQADSFQINQQLDAANTAIQRTLEQFQGSEQLTRRQIFTEYCNLLQNARVSLRASEISREYQAYFSNNPSVVGVVLYHASTKEYKRYFLNSTYTALTDFLPVQDVRTSLMPFSETGTLQVEGHTFLFYHYQQHYGNLYLIADPMLDASVITLQQAAASTGGQVLFQDGTFSYVPGKHSILQSFDRTQRIVIFILGMLIFFIPVMWVLIQQQLIAPIKKLSHSFDVVADENPDYRLPDESGISELHRAYSGFNEMLDTIHDTKEEMYRHQIDAVQAKLQYLQLQIRPHFYLNCLKNINSLVELHEDEKIQDLVGYLSEYFRYSFQDVKSFLPLREELEAANSYVNLCNCLSREIEIAFDIDSRTMAARCLPLTILTFVENSIKHSENSTFIEIQTRLIQENGHEMIAAIIRNTGAFPEEQLASLNAADPSVMSYDREHVGISNVRYRLWLIYQEKASLTFANEDGNAVVNVCFPFEK